MYLVSQKNVKLNIPNVISFGRLLSVPVAVWLILHQFHLAAFWIFVAACISDAADGYIAKTFDLQTELGGFLDPIADKALLICVFVTLGQASLISTWLVILVVFRDALIVCGALLYHLLYQNLTIQIHLISKLNTTFQFILAALVLGEAAFSVLDQFVISGLEYLVGVTTVASGTSYVIIWSHKAIDMEQDE